MFLLPVADEPSEKTTPPYITIGLIVANVLGWIVQNQMDLDSSIAAYGFHASALAAEPFSAQVWQTLLASMFMHAGWWHIIGNMLYLWVFGDDIEYALGRPRFLLFYVVSGIGADLFFTLFNRNFTTPMVGASGAISGVLAAYLLLRPCAKVALWFVIRTVEVQAFWVIGIFIASQIWAAATMTASDVAYLDHIGGFIAGALLFIVLRPSDVRLFDCPSDGAKKLASTNNWY
jgi:membrane associated rhomboid family serine protease